MTTNYYYTRDKLKLIYENVDKYCKDAQFTPVERFNVRRDVRYFGVDLFTVNGELFKKLDYNLDSKMLHHTSKDKTRVNYMADFIEKFNKGITCKDPNYLLSENSEFYLNSYRTNFIIILDKINDLTTNKRCFNMEGDLLTKVQDTLNTKGELNREGLEYTAVYKETIINKLERNSSISSSDKEQSQTTDSVDKIQHKDLQQTTPVGRSITLPEDSKVSISKSQSEDHKGYSDTSTSHSEELSQKKSKSIIPILTQALYKLGITTPKLLYVT